MKDLLKIKKIIKCKNKVVISFDFDGKWRYLLKKNEMIYDYNFNVETIPDSIVSIPFLCNVLSIAYVFDLNIHADKIDNSFYNSIDNIRKGYQDMYKKMKLGGKVFYDELIDNNYDNSGSIALFSSGVDAYNTLFNHMEEKPILFTLCGSDISLSDKEGWNRVEKLHVKTANKFDLNFSYVKSNFREIIYYGVLSDYVRIYYHGEWWHEFQHGIAILGHAAPVAYYYGCGKVYIASTYTENEKGKYTCASDPTIDNHLKFGKTIVIHDGYKYTRQQKIENICKYLKKNNINNLDLRVCWESNGGNNCCKCEKCYRTILGILAEKYDPNSLGFDFSSKNRKKMIENLKGISNKNNSLFYVDIQKRMKKNYNKKTIPKDLYDFFVSDISYIINESNENKYNSKIKFYLKVFAKSILHKLN